MQHQSCHKQRPPAPSGATDNLLPSPATQTPAQAAQGGLAEHTKWTVTTSTKPWLRDGKPVGLRHDLLYDGKSITSGVGANTLLFFEVYAQFLNERGIGPNYRPLSRLERLQLRNHGPNHWPSRRQNQQGDKPSLTNLQPA